MTILRWGIDHEIWQDSAPVPGGTKYSSSIAVLADGSIVAATSQTQLPVFYTPSTILVARYGADGAPGTTATLQALTNPVSLDMVALPDNSFALAYSSFWRVPVSNVLNHSVMAYRLDAGLALLKGGANGMGVGFAVGYGPSLAVAGNEILAAYTYNNDQLLGGQDARLVQFRSLTGTLANGTIPDTGVDISRAVPSTDTVHTSTDIVRLDDGNIVVSWYDGNLHRSLYRVFSASGSALTGELPVSGLAGTPDTGAQMTALRNGGMVMTWSQTGAGFPAGSGSEVWAQLVGPDGTRYGSAFLVTAGNWDSPAGARVIEQQDGTLLFAFAVQTSPGNSDIVAAVFDIYGRQLQSDTIVATGDSSGLLVLNQLALTLDGRVVLDYSDVADSSAHYVILDARNGNIHGTNGDETLYGHDLVNDQIFGLDGNDTLFGYAGNDLLDGGLGNDALSAGLGDDTLFGGGGSDQLAGGAGADGLFGGDGFDFARYDDSPIGLVVDLANPGANSGFAAGDSFSGIEGLVGSAYNDILRGDGESNWFYGLAGDDVIFGRDGGDALLGGDGNDFLYGEAGSDTLYGGNGDDHLIGGTGIDFMYGEAGYDFVHYDGAAAGVLVDLLNFTENTGEATGDQFFGIEGIVGSGYDDSLRGDSGANWIYGGGGADFIYGRDGHDVLLGNDGNDTLYGNAGNDTLYGGAGSDKFVFGVGDGQDVVADGQFGAGAGDQVWLAAALGAANLTDVLAHSAQIGGDVVITFNGTTTMTLAGVSLAALNADDFVFY